MVLQASTPSEDIRHYWSAVLVRFAVIEMLLSEELGNT